MEKTRIQKLIAGSGFCSRRKAEQLIAEHRVTCNGRPVHLGDQADGKTDRIAIDGEKLDLDAKPSLRYLKLYKPRGYVSTMSDEKGRRCVADLLADVGERVYPVGRLDVNSEGLLLCTSDGDLANKIMHPRHQVAKTYRVTVRPDLSDEQAARLSEGIDIDGKKTAPATVRVLTKQTGRVVLELTLHEGRNREIRRMMETLGLTVARLKRTSIGPIKLGMLRPGHWRDLTSEEQRALKNAVK